MLFSTNLSYKLINIIMSCISTSELVILLNGTPTSFFKLSRGVRQGDPLSPYLFILGIKLLFILINTQVTMANWTPIAITTVGPLISHTLFADDVFLFAEATLDNASTILNVLNGFSTYSGLIINLNKSKIFFSNNCDDQISNF